MDATPGFKNICATTRGFNVRGEQKWGGKPWPGMVVASREALYFVVRRDLLLGRGQTRVLPREVEWIVEKDLSGLPEKVTGDADWPVTWREGPVIVVPRRAVRGLRTSFWLGGIEVLLDGVSIRVFTPLFQRKQMAAYLVQLGWKVEGLSGDR